MESGIAGFHSNRSSNHRQTLLGFSPVRVWKRIAFSNYVQEIAASGPRQAPSDEMFRRSESAFLELLALLRPTHVLVLGYRPREHMREFAGKSLLFEWNGSKHQYGEYEFGGHRTLAAAIKHPSTGFSVAFWHPVIRTFLAITVGTAKKIANHRPS
jgi:hypothetical protein